MEKNKEDYKTMESKTREDTTMETVAKSKETMAIPYKTLQRGKVALTGIRQGRRTKKMGTTHTRSMQSVQVTRG